MQPKTGNTFIFPEAEMTSARLQFALDAMDAEIEEQRRLVDILREQFHALGRNNGEAAMGDPTEVLSAISSASPIHVFTESRRADDSAVGSDITASSPAAALQSLSESLTNGCANGIGACPVRKPSSSRLRILLATSTTSSATT